MLQIMFFTNSERNPAGVRNPVMLLGETRRQQCVMNSSRKRDVEDPARVNVSYFSSAIAEFPSAKTMRVTGYIRPRQNGLRQFLQVLHHAPCIPLFDARLIGFDSNP